jgi:hypothetical protein
VVLVSVLGGISASRPSSERLGSSRNAPTMDSAAGLVRDRRKVTGILVVWPLVEVGVAGEALVMPGEVRSFEALGEGRDTLPTFPWALWPLS